MPLDHEKMVNFEYPESEHSYTEQDTILYALSVGLGAEPNNPDQLKFVYEKDLQALPMMAGILGWLGRRPDPGFGVNLKKVVAGEQKIILHKPLPTSATFISRSKISDVLDKGERTGALIYYERDLFEKESGDLLASIHHTIVARGDGNFGGKSGPTPPLHELPERQPDQVCEIQTAPNMALLYRLNGDENPLHADPERAQAVGFDKPILHGLGTFAVAGHAILQSCCNYDPARLLSLQSRFSRPVFPGDIIRTEMWIDGDTVSFRSLVSERDHVVLNNGMAKISNTAS
ncbi:MAG: 3-alpha,7-alpha,12-alpha-trihydroxy-5-beta-cholest-24-enoyl-CoA hydratase [Rhodospirillaceae bacterium]|mgnify:FL=1|jgi:acyl dehydratase|nr:3-alpha,7-alpha,12-alpha-trihydroxy-5-beta-cholest-24-enoyl-CoA hydratase [Rhodospirillaceae bacterium]MBT5938753.1 3-alpha,7-alpha,12-alpha-trihydroxy-5-beta-cholest-24-enoyl-CoA hydratase [Rhodospirillaceae bacterium]MBT7268401.1 3-alpha,7-alpha,12-alpha-trihydroxy-5-beta-cholest-24-enoyl-CoA hydratase [Rhodospirillaceae bacterium]